MLGADPVLFGLQQRLKVVLAGFVNCGSLFLGGHGTLLIGEGGGQSLGVWRAERQQDPGPGGAQEEGPLGRAHGDKQAGLCPE